MDLSSEGFAVIQHAVYGYRHLDPLPGEKEITRFYESQYYDLIRKGGRAPELRRLMSGGEEAERERSWLRTTLYSDVCHLLNQYAPGKRVLDVGCGTGEFISYLKENGFDVVGIEPSSEAAGVATATDVEARGISVYNSTFEEFVESSDIGTFDSLTFLNVLEHVLNPAAIIEISRTILNPRGTICVRVPNDFSELQSVAQVRLNKKPWWIAIPDHINYFDFRTLQTFLNRLGFEIIYSQGDFPMELFLLMGDDYVGNPDIGNKCHERRVNFEMSIPAQLRRRIYRALAEVGVGRDCLVFGRRIN